MIRLGAAINTWSAKLFTAQSEVSHVWMQIRKVRNNHVHRAMVYRHSSCVEIVVH